MFRLRNNYILKNKNDELFSFYYGENRGIYCEKLGNYPSKMTKVCVIDGVADLFTVSLNENNNIYVICQNSNGDVMLCEGDGNLFKNEIIFKNRMGLVENAKFYPIFNNNSMSLIYNINSKESSDSYITIRTLLQNKNWTNPENIDIFSSAHTNMFSVYKVSEDNFMLFYCKGGNRDTQIGLKQVKSQNISEFTPLHKTGYQIFDYSAVCHNDTIHFIYIVKSLFSNQVIYRKKDNLGISTPIVLFEGQKIKNCAVCIINNMLYCKFLIGTSLYYVQSEDFGNTFSQAFKYKKTLSLSVSKAVYISNFKENETSLNEVFIDTQNTLNIQFLPEFYNGFSKDKNFINNRSVRNDPYEVNNNNFISNLDNQLNSESKHNSQVNVVKEQNKEFEGIKVNRGNKEITQDTNKKVKRVEKGTILESDFMANFDVAKLQDMANNARLNNIKNKTTYESSNNFENTIKVLKEQLTSKNKEISKLNELVKDNNSDNNISVEAKEILIKENADSLDSKN